VTRAVTLVVPVYNEAGRLQPGAFAEALVAMPWLSFRFVDDGSVDRSAEVIAGLARAYPSRVTLGALPENRGKGEAVRAGLREAIRGEVPFVGFWDADLATPLAELPRLLAPMELDPDILVVLASRVRLLGRSIQRRPFRHYLGRVFATAASLVLRVPVYDTQCGAKLFRNSPALHQSLEARFHSRWIFDVELLARLGAAVPGGLENRAVEVPVSRWMDVGASRLRFSDWLRAPAELVTIWWWNRRTMRSQHDGTR
jgi:dolichyl-phosphate beta-glucosyltransferase